jgi:hypothetical protein
MRFENFAEFYIGFVCIFLPKIWRPHVWVSYFKKHVKCVKFIANNKREKHTFYGKYFNNKKHIVDSVHLTFLIRFISIFLMWRQKRPAKVS